ncbi:hypothetical protein PGT21_017938 [Puccinia graminis f. sp. tritici]|uniref:Transcription factor domain-containing protein n=1 Tax=Puccinia graminis f. sp. tritici TaxID=56615 RepID=A0A5B0NYQ8_PUCGR|nr:hypothetical protein PGTUg99_021175 [Puccinia graminis f. sp. tritici]KAA1094325.1 hypothetical protein PGT21_017938 [Puccinia graminis f. sp. tritici]
MQQSNPTPTPNLDELEVRGERIKERVDLNYSLAQELERSLDELDPQIQSLRQTSPTLTTFMQQPPTASAGYSMAPQPSKRLRCEIPPITPKTRPKIPVLAAKGYPLQKLSPDHDPTVPKAMAPVGLNPTSAQILDWPRRGDAAHRISFILNPNMNPAKENKRDLEPPSASSVNSQEADNPCSEESSRPSLHGLSDSFSTVSIPGSGTAAPIRLSGEDTDMEPKLMQMYCTTFFKRYSNRLTWSPTERASAESLKRASDLLLFAILSASDPKSTQPGMGSTYYQNALTMSRQTVFPEKNYNIHDLKGIMILAIYHGLHCVCPHFVSLCLTLKLHKVFVKLTDPNLRGEANEAELVEMGRTWLLVVIYSHFLCIFSRKLYLIGSPPEMICNHAKTLESSKFVQPCDRLINAHVNLVMVLALAQDKLDPRNYSGCMSERKEKHVLPEISLVMLELDQWATDWKFQCPQLFTTKSMGPRRFLQNAQQYVTLYIMHAAIWPCQDGRMIITNQRRYQWALDGCHHAQNILEAVLDLKDEIDANEEDDSQLCPDDLPLNIEYHKATLGLVTGYLLWISLIIPGHVNLESNLGLFRRLHGLKFKFSCEYIEIIEKSILSIHEILSLQAIHPDPHHGLPDLDHQQLSYKIGTSLQEKGCQLGPNELRLGWVGEYSAADRSFRMGDDMAKELDKLMTDTQFWFQLELE